MKYVQRLFKGNFLTYFTLFSNVSIVDFEQVNVSLTMNDSFILLNNEYFRKLDGVAKE